MLECRNNSYNSITETIKNGQTIWRDIVPKIKQVANEHRKTAQWHDLSLKNANWNYKKIPLVII